MIQVEIIENVNEKDVVDEANYFLSHLEEALFIDIRFSSFLVQNNDEMLTKYCILIIYRVI